MKKTKILVVDDEEHIRFLYSEELEEAGYEVITADGGYKLLERIEQERPDLVVLDIKMVDYNGLDLLADIRNKYYGLPVILCTAYDTLQEDMKSIAADFYSIKSFDLTDLKSKIALAIKSSYHKWEIEEADFSLNAITQRLIRLLNMQTHLAPVAKEVSGYAKLRDELWRAGISQEELNRIDAIFQDKCNVFGREMQESTEFIRDYLLKNYKEESCESDKILCHRASSLEVVSYNRLRHLYIMERSQDIESLREHLAAFKQDWEKGDANTDVTLFLTKYAKTSRLTLDTLIRKWLKKLDCRDISGIPVYGLLKIFQSDSENTEETGRIQSIILREVRHDLKNVISRFTILVRKLEKETSYNLHETSDIQAKLTALLEGLSKDDESNRDFSLQRAVDELYDVISRFTTCLGEMRTGVPKNKLDELSEIRVRLITLLDRLRELSVFSMRLREETLCANDFIKSLLGELGMQQDSRIAILIEPRAEEVNTDSRFLGVALRQVIQNATEAVASDGSIKITVRAGVREGESFFFVEDNGPGIPSNLVEEVIKPCVGYNKFGHTGMGLALCREALKEIGGEILIHSVVNKGTKIEIRLHQEARICEKFSAF